MKTILLTIAGVLTIVAPVWAEDPGSQDSVIVGSIVVQQGQTRAFVPVWTVTDDSVVFYNIPLTWNAPRGGVHGENGSLYYPPLINWDEAYDSLMAAESYFRIVAWADLDSGSADNPSLFTSGQRWHMFSIRMEIDPNAPAQTVTIDTTYDARNGSLLMGTPDGLTEFAPAFVRGYIAITESQAADEDGTIPSEFTLSQNYPNPFNPSTNIRIGVPSGQHVLLEVYNVVGQRVATLIDEVKDPGWYSVTWDGSDDSGAPVASGIYPYRLVIGDRSETKTMILLH